MGPTQELPAMFRNKLIQVNRRDVQPEDVESEVQSHLLGVAADEEALTAIMGRIRSESKVDAEWLKEMIAGIQHEASLAWQNGAELLVFSDTDLSMGGRDDEDLAVWTVQRLAPEVTSLLQSQEEWGNRQGINWSMRGRCFGACPTQELPSMFRNKLIQVNRRDVQPEEVESEVQSHLLGVAADEEALAAIMGRIRSESKVDAEWLKEMIAGIQHEASLAWQNGAELLVFSDTDLSMGGRDDEDLAVWTVQRRAPEVASLLQSQEEWGNKQGINWSMRGRCFGACPTQE